jgi:hypothetical protein
MSNRFIDRTGGDDPKANVSTFTSVSGTNASSQTILAQNLNRLGVIIVNESTASLFLKLGVGPASSTSYTVKLAPGATYTFPLPIYTGIVTGIWDAINGHARVDEFTA